MLGLITATITILAFGGLILFFLKELQKLDSPKI